MKRSPGPIPCSPLTTNRTASAPSSSCSTRRCMRSVSTSRGRWTPGRSTSTSCQPSATSVATPRLARRVVCGRSEMIATLAPTIALTSVDLPTLGRPARPTKPARVGHPRSPRSRLHQYALLQREHLAVVGLVVVAAEVEHAVDRRLDQVRGVRRADDDVAELARAGGRAGAVDREREHVGGLVRARGARG